MEGVSSPSVDVGVSQRGDDTMTRDEKIIRNKVGVLELAKQLGSVSQACRIMGFSRDSFYRFKDLYEKGGEVALIEMSRRVPNPKNRIGETIERRILEMTLKQPAWGHTRMANAKRGVGGQGGAGRPDPDREPTRRSGEGEGGQG